MRQNYKSVVYQESTSIPNPWYGSMVKTGNQVQGYTDIFKLYKTEHGAIPYEAIRIYMHSN